MRRSQATKGGSSRTRIAVALAASVLALLAIPSVPAGAGAGAPPAAVRVNQVGYDLHGPKRAYLMSPVSEAGTTFAVVRAGGQVAYTAPVGASTGAWSDTYGFVYPLDFDAVAAAGRYR